MSVTVYLDGMGGDYAPLVPAEGALEALSLNPDLRIVLSGPLDAIKEAVDKAFAGHEPERKRLELCDCPEIITLDEAPMMAVRKKKQSAFTDGMLKLRDGAVDVFVSAGSTGALLAGGMLRLGRIPGIERPAVATLLPTGKGHVLLLDSGANTDCQPQHLHQFALMAKAYLSGVFGMSQPRIGLINNGAEAEKGCQLTKEVYQRLQADERLQFVGNVEARDILSGNADALVCDGFVGNTVLKYTEGMASVLFGMLKESLMSSFVSKIGAMLAKPSLKAMKKKFDYTEVGGAPLLGVNGCVIKAHGSSNAHAIACAIRQGVSMAEGGVCEKLKSMLQTEREDEENGI